MVRDNIYFVMYFGTLPPLRVHFCVPDGVFVNSCSILHFKWYIYGRVCRTVVTFPSSVGPSARWNWHDCSNHCSKYFCQDGTCKYFGRKTTKTLFCFGWGCFYGVLITIGVLTTVFRSVLRRSFPYSRKVIPCSLFRDYPGRTVLGSKRGSGVCYDRNMSVSTCVSK